MARLILLLSAVVAAYLVLAPPRVTVNGVRISIGRHWTVADCARSLDVRLGTGDLLDVKGNILVAGGGLPAAALSFGQQVPLTSLAQPGGMYEVRPAADVREPITDTVTYLPATYQLPDGRPAPPDRSLPFVQGLRRERRGMHSRQLVGVETSHATAIVYPPSAPQRGKCLALTFDDGPCPAFTPKIQAVLEAHGARGTFFVLGQGVKPLAKTFRAVVEAGHEVGTHSWRHTDYRRLTDQQAEAELRRCVQVMREEGATEVRWFRPPYGARRRGLDQVAAKVGLHIAMWDVDPFDWKRPGTAKIVSRVLAGIKDGAVILLHDGPGQRQQTLAALKILVPLLHKRGYKLVTMSEAKGLAPLFTGRVVLTVGGRRYELVPAQPAIRVELNGRRLTPTGTVLRAGTDLLIPALEALRPLGFSYQYDAVSQVLTVAGAAGKAVLRLDSLHCELNGQPTTLTTPPVLYCRAPYVPLSLLKRLEKRDSP